MPMGGAPEHHGNNDVATSPCSVSRETADIKAGRVRRAVSAAALQLYHADDNCAAAGHLSPTRGLPACTSSIKRAPAVCSNAHARMSGFQANRAADDDEINAALSGASSRRRRLYSDVAKCGGDMCNAVWRPRTPPKRAARIISAA